VRSGSTQMPFSWMTWTFAMALILAEGGYITRLDRVVSYSTAIISLRL
jgi:hypothetical protein